MNANSPVVVIGAGPAGIGAGIALGAEGLVLDATAEPGGLCRTIELDGAVFDWGGHSFHTPHPYLRELVFAALPMFEQPRHACCFVNGSLLPYPFQAHFRRLPNGVVVQECAAGLAAARGGDGARHFEEYLVGRFGAGIAHHFLLPYNRKLWGGDLQRLAVDWTGDRVAAAEGNSERFAESGGRRTPLQTDTRVAYPAQGGFGEIMRALARRLPHLRLGRGVARIDPLRRELATDRGEVIGWKRLVSTLPLDQLVAILPDVPPRIHALVARLEALPLALVLVVVDHAVDTPIQRIYSAGDEIPAHKVVINHNSSPSLRALPRHGILAEVSLPGNEPPDARVLERRVVKGLRTLGLIRALDEVCSTRVISVRRAYPVPRHDRDEIVRELKAWLLERGIYPVGRFAEWAYINSDEALHRGFSLGERLRGEI
jgi:UDP-galactopyranose mutase